MVEEHTSILQKEVAANLNEAFNKGMIPPKYQNVKDMGNIANVILSGVNPTENQDIYDIGISIVKEISDNYQQKYDIIYPETYEGQDKTRPKSITIPEINN